MRVAVVIVAALLSLLSHAPTPCAAAGDQLRFQTVTAQASWPGRRQAWTAQLSGTIRGASRSFPNPLALMGGFTPEWSEDYNDVWLSSDNGRNWYQVSGMTVDGDDAGESFPSEKNNGGTFALLPSGTIIRVSQDVYASSNGGVTWRQVPQGSYPYEQRNLPTMVATSRGTLIRAAGQDSFDFTWRNDVITSTDQGRNWRLATAEAAWSARFVNTMLSMPSSIDGGKDITYVIAGRDNVDNYNDVWASSDDGKSWVVISGQAPFLTRASANGVVTKDGLMVIAGGFADNAVGRFNTDVANDVWLSMNGGYSWGLCRLDAEWSDRFQQSVTLTSDGYLLVMSGAVGDAESSTVENDVWRSTTSFHDLPAIARVCGLTVPSCGTGLKCWPGAGTVVATDGSFVSCAACPDSNVAGGSSSTSASMAMTIALVAFVILFVLAAAGAFYFYRQVAASKAAGGPAGGYAGSSFGSADTSGLITSDHHL